MNVARCTKALSLLSFTFIITGINLVKNKEFILLIENTFFVILYCIFGTLFLTHFYSDAFTLYINGNGGFVGNFLNQSFLNQILLLNNQLSYYILIILILLLFLKSINFNPFKIFQYPTWCYFKLKTSLRSILFPDWWLVYKI